MNDEGLADAAAANPFVYPDFTQVTVTGHDPGDLSRGAIHRLASDMCLIDKEKTVYA